MARINVFHSDPMDDDAPQLVGWFDDDKIVEDVRETKRWDGQNHRGVMSGLQIGDERLYRTAGGRWVTRYDARSEFNGSLTYTFLTDREAREWLLRDGDDEIVERYWGKIPEEDASLFYLAHQRAMVQAELDKVMAQLKATALREAKTDRQKTDIAREARITRATLDAWIEQSQPTQS